VDILMPMSFIQPALLLALPIQLHWSRWNASYWDSLVRNISCVRVSVCWYSMPVPGQITK